MSGLLGWASDALKQWNERQTADGNKPATKKRAASDDEESGKRHRTETGPASRPASGAAGAAAAAAKRPAARAKKSILRTVEDLEGWLTEVSEEVDAQILQSSARNIVQLLKDSRTASNPTTFPHKMCAGNPLRPAMAFEEVLLQEGTSHVGKLVVNLYRNKLCGDEAQELLAACIGGSEEQVERIHTQIMALLKPMDGTTPDERLVNILCKAIQTLQQRARLERTQLEALELKQQVEQARNALAEGADDADDDAETISNRVDQSVQILDLQLEKFLPKLEEASTTFLFDGTQLDDLQHEAGQLQVSLEERKTVVDASLKEAKANLRDARKRRRQLLLSADDDSDTDTSPREAEQSSEFLNRMKSAEEARVAQQAAFEQQISDAIATMEELSKEHQEADGRKNAAVSLVAFVESVKTVYAECTAAEKVESDKEHRQLVSLYGQDVSALCDTMEQHFTLHCKRVHHFHEQLAPKHAQLTKLKSLGLKKGEASINRTALESELAECVGLITQSVHRVQQCKAKLTAHVLNFKKRQAALKLRSEADAAGDSTMDEGEGGGGEGEGEGDDEGAGEATLVRPAPSPITGGHAGSFMATGFGHDKSEAAADGKPLRVTVDGYGLSLHKNASLVAFYDYRAIRSWDMSDEHFGVTPSRLAKDTGMSERYFALATREGRAIAKMMNANALLLVQQSGADEADGSSLLVQLLSQYQSVADYCWLICAFCEGEGAHGVEGDAATTKLSYRGQMQDGIPHGIGKLTIGAAESFEGEFVAGQPKGRGKYTASNGWCYEGVFHGRRPAGGSHIYKATHTTSAGGGGGSTVDVYEGQLNPHSCSFHGTGRLASRSAVPGMVVQYEGAFEGGEPHSSYARLWMYPTAVERSRRDPMVEKVAVYKGALSRGIPSSTGELYLPALRASSSVGLKGNLNRTTYRGTFDGVSYMNYGKPAGAGSILFTNGNVYSGPIMEADGSCFMPVPMMGELIVRPGASIQQGLPGAGATTECIYRGEFDSLGRPEGEGKLERVSDGKVIHEGQFEKGEPVKGWMASIFG